ncbi:TRAP transporter substrate-binding protein [Paracoccus sp. Z330]|uniref:TRAP transporter substrate-binding protein n=1 Tax=Paracoccus onchidii TaxID=3017813 RepID=A0ABT4ZGG2_9RHOB|nr:TRAP transporter substrate-binding protein [Paracoccus onchidii]MDB6178401.1 TRAP transporter substrate-binding protein [Paracoccus onchidii]
MINFSNWRMRGLAVAMFAGCAALVPATGSAQNVTANLNHQMTGTVIDEAVQRMAADLGDQSEGRIDIKVHSRGEMGGERDMFDLMQVGAIEMGVTGSVIVSAVAPEYGVLDAPYLFNSPEHLARVMDGPIGDDLKQTLIERKGIRIIGRMDRAPRHLSTGGKEVRTPSDLSGLKIRMREIPAQIEAFRELGASPVPMAFGEVYTALQTGVLDAQENPLDIIMGTSLHEVQETITLTGHVREVQYLVVSDLWWQSLGDADRALVQEAADQAMNWGQTRVYQADADLVETARAEGLTIIELTPEQRASFSAGVADLPQRFAGKWKDGLYQQIVEAGQ